LSWQGSAQERDELAARCVRLLEGRARMLGMDMSTHGEEYSPVYRADLVVMDVLAHRHFEPPGKIASLLEGYPRTRGFLGLAPDKISSLVREKADFAYYASIAMHVEGSKPFHEIPRAGPLDRLESMLQAMEGIGLDAHDGRYDGWRKGLCKKEFNQRLLYPRP